MEGPMENPKNNPKLPEAADGFRRESRAEAHSTLERCPQARDCHPQPWSAARKREIVIRLLRGESLDGVSRQIGVEP
jgi:hypothetical protein